MNRPELTIKPVTMTVVLALQRLLVVDRIVPCVWLLMCYRTIMSNASGVLCTGGQFFPNNETGYSSEWVVGSIKTGEWSPSLPNSSPHPTCSQLRQGRTDRAAEAHGCHQDRVRTHARAVLVRAG